MRGAGRGATGEGGREGGPQVKGAGREGRTLQVRGAGRGVACEGGRVIKMELYMYTTCTGGESLCTAHPLLKAGQVDHLFLCVQFHFMSRLGLHF